MAFTLKTTIMLIVVCASSGATVDIFKEYRFTTRVDHFAYHEERNYEMRYFVSDLHWNADGGPVFFYTGNQDSIENFIQKTGLLQEWAPEFNALIVYAEHRFYGDSLPFRGSSFRTPDKLGYLTSEQALADYADLILHIRRTLPGAETSPFIAFGGSYGGMLAAMMRLKYPHLVAAALSSSAPMKIFSGMAPCSSYLRAVTEVFQSENDTCVSAIRQSWDLLENMASTIRGQKDLQRIFQLCQRPDRLTYPYFRDWVKATYETLARDNYADPSLSGSSLPPYPVKEACDMLTHSNANGTELLELVYKVMNLVYKFTGRCNDILRIPTSAYSLGFQRCTELIHPVCSDGVTDMFYSFAWDQAQESENCRKTYGVHSDVTKGYLFFGGSDLPTASKIIFSNGDRDPWSVYGVEVAPTDKTVVLLIEGAAHHEDLRHSSPEDSEALRSARLTEKNYIRQWISNASEILQFSASCRLESTHKYFLALFSAMIIAMFK